MMATRNVYPVILGQFLTRYLLFGRGILKCSGRSSGPAVSLPPTISFGRRWLAEFG